MKTIYLWVFFSFILFGCSSGMVATEIVDEPTSRSTITTLPTIQSTSTSILPASTQTEAAPIPTKTQIPSTPTPVCVVLYYEENAQVELISPEGVRVLIDVYNPDLLSSPVSEKDTLLTTHTHWDHINPEFQKNFPGPQLFNQEGLIEREDVTIQGIASAHNATDTLKPQGSTNTIYVIEMGNFRIVHFGDIGQNALTPGQLIVLAETDIAITQLANTYSDMSAENRKGFNLIDQVKPHMIIPTHINLDTATLATAKWHGVYSSANQVNICESDLSEEQTILFIGPSATSYADRLDLSEFDR